MTVAVKPDIALFENENGSWTARDEATGVASQGVTREDALENLDEAVRLHTGDIGESIETWEAEREILADLGLDPEEIKRRRVGTAGLPACME